MPASSSARASKRSAVKSAGIVARTGKANTPVSLALVPTTGKSAVVLAAKLASPPSAPSLPGLAASTDTAAERAYRRIEEAIVTMEITPGAIVSESFLSELCGLGRGPVREAVRRLSFERLLIVKPKRGICITEIDPVAQQRLLEVRQEIERLAFRSAARRATPEQRAIFTKLSEEFRRSAKNVDELLFIRTDKAFNDLSIKTARNEFTAETLLRIQGLSRRFWFRYFGYFQMLKTSAELHADVAAAISAGDLEQVSAASDRLSLSAQEFAKKVSS